MVTDTLAPVHLDPHNSRFHPYSSLVHPGPVGPAERPGTAKRSNTSGSSTSSNFARHFHPIRPRGFSPADVIRNQSSPPCTPVEDEIKRQDHVGEFGGNQTSMESCVCGCGGGACIPQREYDKQKAGPLLQHTMLEVVLFSVNGKCGYPLGNALKGQYAGLDRRDNKILLDSEPSISIRLEVRPSVSSWSNDGLKLHFQWMPYEGWSAPVSTGSLIPSCGC